MNKHISRFFRLALPLLLVCQAAYGQSANNVYSQAGRSVGIVIVSTFEGQLVGSGSAVTVASQTMVTNRHVLLPGHRYQVYVNGALHEAYMTSCDSTQDLCLMEVRNLEAKPVEFGDANKLGVGDVVYAIGAPNEISNIVGVAAVTKQKSYSAPQLTLSNGLITALRPVEDGNIIQTNAAISPGSSGGGLFDAQGRLIGITTFMMRSGQGLNMALPVNWVERMGVSGAPRTAAESLAQGTPSATRMPSANSSSVTTSVPQEITGSALKSAQNNAGQPAATSGATSLYWWFGLPLLLLAIYLLRRRQSQDEDDGYDIAPPTPANPLLQRFLDEAKLELDQNRPDAEVWSMAIADNKGNTEAARQSYIERRAARLLSAEKDRQWAAAARQSQAT